MIQQDRAEFGTTAGVTIHRGVDAVALSELQSSLGFRLPLAHAELLDWSNGVEAFHGYFRLFGVKNPESVDTVEWNSPDCWKFAWEDRCLPYWCFGETAWGDQYAYAIKELRMGGSIPVYLLEGLAMTPEIIASSFTEFLETEFLRNAREPYDQLIYQAKQKFGPMDVASHLVYVPSILLGGTEDIDNVQKMNGRAAMICNGDIAIQLDHSHSSSSVTQVKSYEDSEHRMRIKLFWD